MRASRRASAPCLRYSGASCLSLLPQSAAPAAGTPGGHPLTTSHCLSSIRPPCSHLPTIETRQNKVKNAPNTTERTSIIQELLPAMKLVKCERLNRLSTYV